MNWPRVVALFIFKMAPKLISFLQLNVGKGRIAYDNLQVDVGNDVLLIQEPYTTKDGKPYGGWNNYDVFFNLQGRERRKTITCVKRGGPSAYLLTEFTDNNVVAIEIDHCGDRLIVVNLYCERDSNMEDFLAKIQPILTRGNKVIVAGDFNARHAVWGDTETDQRGLAVETFICRNGLDLGNIWGSAPTFRVQHGHIFRRSWIDLTLSRGIGLETWRVNEEDTYSDHASIAYGLRLGLGGEECYKRFLYRRADWVAVRGTLEARAVQLEGYLDSDGARGEEAAELFTRSCVEACRSGIPTTDKPSYSKPWWSRALWEEKKRVRRLRVRYQRANSDSKENFKVAYHDARRLYKQKINEAKVRHWRNFCEDNSNKDPFGLPYKILAGKDRQQGIPRTLRRDDGTWTNPGDETNLHLLRTYFPDDQEGIEDREHEAIRRQSVDPSNPEMESPITEEELRAAVAKAKPDSAPGLDGIPASSLWHIFETVGILWLRVLNLCREQGVFPACWKKARIVLAPKPDGKFRPICVLSVVGKIYDRIVTSRLMHWLETHNLLSARQFGYRGGRDSTDAMREYCGKVKEYHQEKLHCVAVTLDISNAFNKAWNPMILYQMRRKSVPACLFHAVESFLSERQVNLNGTIIETNRGCPQGSCLGPVLWLLVMEDLLELSDTYDSIWERDRVHIQATADDTLAVVAATSVKLVEENWILVWADLKAWAHRNKLCFNCEKTHFLFHPFRRVERPPILWLDHIRLEPDLEMKYLGFMVDPKFLWGAHLEYLRGRTANLGVRLRAVVGRTWGITPKVLRELVYKCIIPMFLYGASVWGHRAALKVFGDKLDSLLRALLLCITRAYSTVSTQGLYVLAGVPPLSIQAVSIFEHFQRVGGEEYSKRVAPGAAQHPSWYRDFSIKYYQEDNLPPTRVFTDGSKLEGHVGAAYVIMRRGQIVGGRDCRLPESCSVFQAELQAIFMACEDFSEINPESEPAVICSDSGSALMAIMNNPGREHLALDIRCRLQELRKSCRLDLVWVKAHVGIPGNEEADRRAKIATTEGELVGVPLPVSHSRQIMKQHILESWQGRWRSSTVGADIRGFIPDVALKSSLHHSKIVQFISAHGNMKAYLKKIGKAADAICECGGGNEDPKHIFEECSLPFRQGARMRFLKTIVPAGISWETRNRLMDSDIYQAFKRFATESIEDAFLVRGGPE